MSKVSKLGRRLRPSPGVAIGVLALVFAVSGVAVALPGKNNVTAKNIKKDAVTAKAIKNGSVTESKLADGAVTTSKLGSNAVTTAKIAGDAVTGGKVDEASLGKVPSATSADTAGKATSADTAAEADNSKALEGKSLAAVRPIAVGIKDESSQGLDSGGYESVMGVNITIPAGGANVVINSGIEVDNNDAGQAGVSCRLKYNGSVSSSTINLTMAGGFNMSVPLTAFIANSSAGTKQALVECQGSIADDKVQFVEGDLAVQAFPIG